MKKLFTVTAMLILTISLQPVPARADNAKEICAQLENQITGDRMKYSVSANVDGPIYFANIGCGIKVRKNDLCAMEMVAWLAGEAHSDEPECACPVLAAMVRALPSQHGAARLDEFIEWTLYGVKPDTAKPPLKSLQLRPEDGGATDGVRMTMVRCSGARPPECSRGASQPATHTRRANARCASSTTAPTSRPTRRATLPGSTPSRTSATSHSAGPPGA